MGEHDTLEDHSHNQQCRRLSPTGGRVAIGAHGLLETLPVHMLVRQKGNGMTPLVIFDNDIVS